MSDGVCHVCRINEACYCRACVRSVDRAVSECDADLRAQLDAERKRADANRDGANAEYERLQAVADAAREERDEATATAMQNARDYAHKNDEYRRDVAFLVELIDPRRIKREARNELRRIERGLR